MTDIDGWRARVQGQAGSVAASRPVLVSCLNLPNGTLVTSSAQGEFSADIYAPPGCTVQVKHDPANLFLTQKDLVNNQRPTEVGIPPAVLISTNPQPQGSTTYSIVGRVTNRLDFALAENMVPYKAAGTINSLNLTGGGPLNVSGTLSVLLPPGSTVPASPGQLIVLFQSVADASGNFTGPNQKFGSVVKTPLGAPIERWVSGNLGLGIDAPLAFANRGNGEYTASFQLSELLPTSLLSGYYRVSFTVNWTGAKWGTPAPGIKSEVANFAYPPDRSFGPTVKVGSPAAPKLPFMLFPDAIYNGARGVEDPAQAWRSVQRITEPASYTVLPRLDALGRPRTYLIDPAVPFLSNTDRGLAFAPIVALKLPSGSVTATITGPGGAQTLGPAPLTQTRSSAPATVGGLLLDQGGGHLEDALQITTNAPSFRYAFPADGAYTIRVQGNVQDESGFTWAMDGTFKVVIADQLDLDPGVMPGLPMKAGEKLPIALQVDPGIPAQVEAEVRFAPNSDASRLVTRTFRGTANRYGYFFSGESFAFDAPGEYAIEYRATYQPAGQTWAGVMAWNGVVAEAAPSISMHGRRGIDTSPQTATLERFTRAQTGIAIEGNHMNYPYRSGDVLLQTDDDSAQVRASFSGGPPELRQFFLQHDDLRLGLEGPASMAQRFDVGEAPFVSKTSTGSDPTIDPQNTDLHAYFYAAANRPGERVRAGVMEDNTDTWYWRFLEQYAAQPGMGLEGDLPGDFKFQYAGGVVRTPAKNYYGRYASLWAQLPNNDRTGSRVIAPFSEPVMRIQGKDISLFAVLTIAKPGSALEVGDRFGLAGQVGPALAARVHVELKAPNGSVQAFDVDTNEIGAFYLEGASQVLTTPGIYTVSVSVQAGNTQGSLLGASSFPLPVTPKAAGSPKTNLPASGVASGTQVIMAVESGTATARMLITIPGWVIEEEVAPPVAGISMCHIDAVAARASFPMVDTMQPAAPGPGLADAWGWLVMVGDGPSLQVRRISLMGPQLWNLG
ncbi:MAG: hypothetical protein EXR49_06020 [Dehalococcoidia bacterium]|nr:hypothetical protein [Dehalococcoidia bacterium]